MDQENLILVTFNYRLGPFGFLNLATSQEDNSTSSSSVSLPRGNMGLKDQTLLLQWLSRNIAHFGGDPTKITLLGESAGAASVHLHTLSPNSRGLFHKAIAISGSALNPWALSQDALKISQNFARKLGCPLQDKHKLLKCLQTAPGEKMVKLQQVLQNPTVDNDLLVPSIEQVLTPDTFLAEHPIQIIRQGRGAKLPFILGVNSGEGGLVTSRFEAMPQLTRKLDKIWRSKIATFTNHPEVEPWVVDRVRSYYFGSVNTTFANLKPGYFQQCLANLSSDSLFFIPAHQAAVEHAKSGGSTYLYYFNYKALLLPSTYSGFRAVTPEDWLNPYVKVVATMIWDWIVEHTLGEEMGPRRFGICHAEDLYQLFNLEGMTGYFTGLDKLVSSAMVESFAMFARATGEK